MIINDVEKPKAVYYIDKKAHPDSEEVVCFGKKTTLGEFRALSDRLNEKTNTMLIFYDDIMQYTSIGLLDLIYKAFEIPGNIPVKSFMNRKKDAKSFIKSVIDMWDINENDVLELERTMYKQLFYISPVSINFIPFLKMREFLTSQTFVFKYNVPGIQDLFGELRDAYRDGRGEYVPLIVDFLNGKTEEQYISSIIKGPKEKNMRTIVCNNAGPILDVLEKRGVETTTMVMTPEDHNLINDEQQIRIIKNEGFYKANQYEIKLMKEGIA